MYEFPLQPAYSLSPSSKLSSDRYLVPGARTYDNPNPAEVDPFDEILGARSAGLEALVERLGELVQARLLAGASAQQAISRDLTYLENLILDRYRHGQRGTDDPAYVKLRLSQLRLHGEARLEEINRWRDTVLLAKDVAELARRADDARRGESLLKGGMA